MKDFKLGIVHVDNEHVAVIEKVGESVYVLTNLGPYNSLQPPMRLNQEINSRTGEIAMRGLERYYANVGDIGDDSAPEWITTHNPSKTDLEEAQNTLQNAINGAYGKLNEELKTFLRNIEKQTVLWW